MPGSPALEPSDRLSAKEYARFCRLRGFFLVEGLDAWRKDLQRRRLPAAEVAAKVAAAAVYVREIGRSFG
jgi:hypothetical protein